MEFVRSLENPPLVVFTTAYAEHAVDGFRVNAVDYLVKPFGFEEFKEAVDRVHIAGEDPLVVLGNFNSILDADPERFLRIHKSHVINLERIRQSGRSSVTLNDGTVLPVGESYRKVFRELL